MSARRVSWLLGPLALLAALSVRAQTPPVSALASPGAPAAPASSSSGAAPVERGSTANMVLVPAGAFAMGSKAKKAEPNESPVHRVTVSAFWLDKTEVTVGAYRACVDSGRCAAPAAPSSRHCTYPRGDASLPINCVGFDEADHFCMAHGKRLPTEAEWEKAARGGSERVYPWGNEEPTCERSNSMKGNMSAEGCGPSLAAGPLPVGGRSKGHSPYGLQDMAGNVEEWVADYYDDRHITDEPSDPPGAAPTTARVLRGGGWSSPWRNVRASARSWGSAMERGPSVGFRCAMTAR